MRRNLTDPFHPLPPVCRKDEWGNLRSGNAPALDASCCWELDEMHHQVDECFALARRRTSGDRCASGGRVFDVL